MPWALRLGYVGDPVGFDGLGIHVPKFCRMRFSFRNAQSCTSSARIKAVFVRPCVAVDHSGVSKNHQFLVIISGSNVEFYVGTHLFVLGKKSGPRAGVIISGPSDHPASRPFILGGIGNLFFFLSPGTFRVRGLLVAGEFSFI